MTLMGATMTEKRLPPVHPGEVLLDAGMGVPHETVENRLRERYLK